MALTVYNKASFDVTATLTQSQSDSLSAGGSWQPSQNPTSFNLRITRPSNPMIDISRSFGPEITSASFQKSGQVYIIDLEPSDSA
jgi:hypothetical protein